MRPSPSRPCGFSMRVMSGEDAEVPLRVVVESVVGSKRVLCVLE